MPESPPLDISNYAVDMIGVCDRYRVSKQTVYSWLSRNWFPIPLALGGRRFWCERDLTLFDRYLIERSRASAMGEPDPPQPAYSIPYGESQPPRGALPKVEYELDDDAPEAASASGHLLSPNSEAR